MKKWIWTCLAGPVVAVLVLRQPELPAPAPGAVISYKGLSNPVDFRGLDDNSCTANALTAIDHPYIENTLPAMAEAFARGADSVHLNLHHTRDGRFAVFHDWRLECRTDGQGVTSHQTSAYLKTLDVGHGYRLKEGDDYPLRGSGVGLMPMFDEVLAAFPTRSFVINMKTADAGAIDALLSLLVALPAGQRGQLTFVGDDAIAGAVAERFAEPRVFSRSVGKQCLIHYALYGWSRFFPASCANRQLILPHKYARYLWGWPVQFAARAEAHGTRLALYQIRYRYDPDYDYRAEGIGTFTGDLLGTPATKPEE